MSVPPALAERFRADLGRLGGAGERLAVAVSGGPDSLALLLLAEAAFPGSVEAATVDHKLRAEAAAEAAFVSRLCAARGIPHAILPVEVAPAGEGVQAAARAARYAALGEWMRRRGRTARLPAHHLDDQAETLVRRLLRGAGRAGLAGIRASGPAPGAPGLRLLRPLLGWRRAELEALVAAAGLDPVRDPGNADERHDRARIRRLLGETGWLDPLPLARSAAALAQAEDALAWAADRLWAERADRAGGTLLLDPAGLPPELARRLLLRALRALNPDAAPRGEEVQRLLEALRDGRAATLAGVKCGGGGGGNWRFTLAPPRR